MALNCDQKWSKLAEIHTRQPFHFILSNSRRILKNIKNWIKTGCALKNDFDRARLQWSVQKVLHESGF